MKLSPILLTLVTSFAILAPASVLAQSSKSSDKAFDWEAFKKTANRSISLGESAAKHALSFRGTPYRMGGTGKSGFDCSGLTMTVFKKWGVQLPRTSTEQFSAGVSVNKSEMKPGDLVFFKGTYRSGVSHVGIFIGNSQFVHAATDGKGVMVSSLNSGYNLNHWAGARRVDLEKAVAKKKPAQKEKPKLANPDAVALPQDSDKLPD
ncbi:MAG: C40 family peptidase [Chthonomonadales bacterium]